MSLNYPLLPLLIWSTDSPVIGLLFVLYFSGPQNDLESHCLGEVNCKGVNVGVMLKSISEQKLRAWGLKLAIMLLHFESPYQEIGRSFGKPTLHVVVKLTLQAGELNLYIQ